MMLHRYHGLERGKQYIAKKLIAMKEEQERYDQSTRQEKPNGVIEWVDYLGTWHRTDGPAVEYPNGTKIWYHHGKCHRHDGPAKEYADGRREWWVDGYHVRSDPHPESVMSRQTGPLRKEWRNVDGQLHRLDGPAVEYNNGALKWFKNGHCHREDGPAVIWENGDKEWWIDGRRHREDGPAVEYINGHKEWWLNGSVINRTDPKFLILLKSAIATSAMACCVMLSLCKEDYDPDLMDEFEEEFEDVVAEASPLLASA